MIEEYSHIEPLSLQRPSRNPALGSITLTWSRFPSPVPQSSPGITSTLGSQKRLKVRITCPYLLLFPSLPAFPSFSWFSSPPSSSPCFPCCSDVTCGSDGQSPADGLGFLAYLNLNGLTRFQSDAQIFNHRDLILSILLGPKRLIQMSRETLGRISGVMTYTETCFHLTCHVHVLGEFLTSVGRRLSVQSSARHTVGL